MNSRPLIVLLLAISLALGPLASAWAQSADTPCESMSMSMPEHDCCGNGMDQAKCLSACLMVAPAVATTAWRPEASAPAFVPVFTAHLGHASILAPPDAAPPKALVS